MGLEIDATYENGVLKLSRDLPLENGQTVRLTIHPPGGRVKKAFGLLRSQLGPEELQRITSSHVVGDVAHRLMTVEAIQTLSRSPTGIAHWLKRHPGEVQTLSLYRRALDEIALIGIDVVSVSGSMVSQAANVSRQ